MTEDNDDKKLTSVKYYVLKDDNASKFYDEWRLKTLAIIRKKGWADHLEDASISVLLRTEATSSNATDEIKKTY